MNVEDEPPKGFPKLHTNLPALESDAGDSESELSSDIKGPFGSRPHS